MATSDTTFYRYTQEAALTVFPEILKRHLPDSNAIYTRLLSPSNTPDRHILYAATFSESTSCTPVADLSLTNHTILFCDRSRHAESHIWIFNPLFTRTSRLTKDEKVLLAQHAEDILLYIRETQIPESSGWPFSSILKFASIHESMSIPLVEAAKKRGANIVYDTMWNHWSINLSSLSNDAGLLTSALPESWKVARVPEDKLDIVIQHSSIKRQKDTLRTLPSVCFLTESGEMVAWAFIGIDGSLSTMHVVEEFRGRGLAKMVARELLGRYRGRDFAAPGGKGDGKLATGYVHAEVGEGNLASEGVMKSLGATCNWRTGYAGIDVQNMQ